MDKSHLNPSSAQYAPKHGPEHSLAIENAATAAKNSNAAYVARSRGTRKLVLCFDGTGNKFHGDDSDSNILKIFRMLDRTADDQYHYYQPGIGTYVVSGSLSHTSVRGRISSWYQKAKDSAVGSSFDQHVVGGYRFLMRFYNPGDEIYMFGFSRGSYIARFLAEMLDFIGLLSHGNEEMVKFAWKAFAEWQRRKDVEGSEEERAAALAKKRKMYEYMKGFRETFSRPVGRIRFLGLFDTVNSVPQFETAWMQRSKFPYTARSSAKVIRHAVSIDERRAKFRQDLMYQGNPGAKHRHHHHYRGGRRMSRLLHSSHGKPTEEVNGAKTDDTLTNGVTNGVTNGADEVPKPSADRGRRGSQFLTAGNQQQQQPETTVDEFSPYRKRSNSRLRTPSASRPRNPNSDAMSDISAVSGIAPSADWDDEDDPQDIDEVWFSGGHGDVGGGWEVLPDSKSASHVPLAWIVREAMRAGLPLDPEKVAQMGCACHEEWDAINPGRLSKEAKQQRKEARKNAGNIPDIRLQQNGSNEATTPQFAPSPEQKPMDFVGSGVGGHHSDHEKSTYYDCEDSDSDDEDEKNFHGVMHKAHVARIHDSLCYDSGLGFTPVTAWKFMEWLPFLRMDLQGDGSWVPIRWPLPRGEVRDVPDDVRVHGSVIRRMQADKDYRPGNLIIGGGGRGTRRAPDEYGIGEWVCVAEKGDPIGEVWVRKHKPVVKNGH